MIILAPIFITSGEAATLRLKYREQNIGFDFTDWDGTWSVVKSGSTVASGALSLSATGDIITTMTATQTAALGENNQMRGRTLPDTYWQGVTTDGTTTLTFRSAVTVIRGLNYGAADTDTDSLTDDSGNTLLAE